MAVAFHSGSKMALPKDRKSTRLNSSHPSISYAVFCLKKKKTRHLCPDRRRPGTGTTAHTCGDTHHVRSAQGIGNAVTAFQRRLTTEFQVIGVHQDRGQ